MFLFFLLTVTASAELTVVQKCCPFGETKKLHGCARTDDSNDTLVSNTTVNLGLHFYKLEYRRFVCHTLVIMDPGEISYRKDGYLLAEDEPPIGPENYCVEFMNYNGSKQLLAFLCTDSVESVEVNVVYPIGIIFSIPFLAVTCCVYAFVKELKYLHGRCVLSHCICMLLAYIALSNAMLISGLPLTTCIILGFAVQFFFLATFFWLNVMCIDIYWAFSGIKLRGTASERDRKKLLAYSFYAWGMPLIILAVTVGVDYSDSIPSSSIFKPNMGKDRCFFKGRTATWTYFYGPMAVILFSNLILFSITAYRIWRHRRETAQSFHRGDSRRHDGNESERFNLYLKLFLVMGINWISELISFMFGKDVPQYLWYITDITNTLQGVFIFLIFVWKKRVRKLLWEKLCGGKQSQLRSSTMTTSTALNSSTR